MTKIKKEIIIIVIILAIIVVWISRAKWPSFARSLVGLYTLSEAMDTESYGLICDVLNDSLDPEYIMKDSCEPGLEHMEIALQKEWRDVMSLFLECGADPNEIGSEGYTLLDRAVCHNSLGMCKLLLDGTPDEQTVIMMDGSEEIRADVNMKNQYGRTALDELCFMPEDEIPDGEWERRAQLLLEHGAKVTEQTIHILQENSCAQREEWINLLLQQKGQQGEQEFVEDDIKQIEKLQKRKELSGEEYCELLDKFQGYGSVETIKRLLEDFSLDAYLSEGQKEILMVKAVSENTEIMELYLDRDFPVTPYVLAASIQNKNFDDKRIEQLICEENQDTIVVNWKNGQDYSLFMIAVEEGREEVVSELYYRDVCIDYKNRTGLTAKKIAKKYNFESIVDLLDSGMNGM